MKKSLKIIIVSFSIVVLSLFLSCQQKNSKPRKIKLNPSDPVSLIVWHYYNGARQSTFNSLVSRFNDTVGRKEGIYVEGHSLGSISDLEKAVTDSLSGKVGAKELPDIFSSYADTAYSAQKHGKLANLAKYFTKEELDSYVDGYISEGYLNGDDVLYLFPTAKSTEIMMINKTAWELFSSATGSRLSELYTAEGVTAVAERYYKWTDSLTPDIPDDGKAFYGRDSMSNYFIIGMRQMGTEIFEVKDGKVSINADKEKIRRLWENYYVPYLKGYFTAYGKFRSDDVKTGDIIAYTGSTSSVMYFPDRVELEDLSYNIDYIIQNAPVMENGENYWIQQGAGMVVKKSDPEHEYAASVFLKWFTQEENNILFVCDSGYLPVKKAANSIDFVKKEISEQNIKINPKVYDCLSSVMENFGEMKFYTPKSFRNGFKVRSVLDFSLSDSAENDRKKLEQENSSGIPREKALSKYISDDSFEKWYKNFYETLMKESVKQ